MRLIDSAVARSLDTLVLIDELVVKVTCDAHVKRSLALRDYFV
jgi:hypothetical protein